MDTQTTMPIYKLSYNIPQTRHQRPSTATRLLLSEQALQEWIKWLNSKIGATYELTNLNNK